MVNYPNLILEEYTLLNLILILIQIPLFTFLLILLAPL